MKTARVLPVLMYHHVSRSPGLVTVSPENFRAQMQDLANAGWHTVSSTEIADFLAGGSLPKRSVAITFDDGYLDNYVHAFPVLREFGLRATLFAVTGWVSDGPARKISDDVVLPDHRGCKAAISAGKPDGTNSSLIKPNVKTHWLKISPIPASTFKSASASPIRTCAGRKVISTMTTFQSHYPAASNISTQPVAA